MSAMLKKIKSLFIEEIEESKTPVQAKAKAKKSTQAAPPQARPNTRSTAATPQPGQATEKFMKILFGAMEKSNLEGFDYLEFKNSLSSLKKVGGMDEATRFQSAFAMAQTMGATPANLLKTAQHYLDVLTAEEVKFEQALDNNSDKQIGSKHREMKELDATIKSKEDQIKKLQAEIKQHQSKKKKFSDEIQKASVKIETTRANFIASYDAITAQIKKDMGAIKEYLK